MSIRRAFSSMVSQRPQQHPDITEGENEEPGIVPEASVQGYNSNLTDIKDAHQCQGLPRFSVDLEKRSLEVEEKLTVAKVLGIVGVGGIGKTTLAKQVFKSISREFEYTCFVENVKGIPMDQLQNSLLASFYKHGKQIHSSKISWRDLERKKTLIAMDGVGSKMQLKALPQLKDFGIGSRVIVTTRDKGILSCLKCYHLYKVDSLGKMQAEKLFCQYAGLEDILDSSAEKEQLKKNVQVVVEKCGGLPLMLEVLGCYLRGHADDGNYWKRTIDQLEKGAEITGRQKDTVWDTWMASYDSLSPQEQKMFIETAIYFFDKPLHRAFAAWSGVYGSAEAMWANLVMQSMVRVISLADCVGFVHRSLWVNELLRKLATSLAKNYMVSRVIEDIDVHTSMDVLNANEVDENTEIVRVLNRQGHLYMHLTMNEDLLVKLRKLKYLEVAGVMPRGMFNSFPKELALLSWEFPHPSICPSVLPQIRHNELRNLAVLELEGWEIPEEFPQELGKLTNLRILSLRRMQGLGYLPEDFGNLSQLQQLKLWDLDLQRLPASFGSLSSLEELDLSLDRLECLPDSFCQLLALKKLDIKSSDFESLPDDLGLMTCLQHLAIECPVLRTLPDSLGDLVRLEYLALRVERVEALPDNFLGLSRIRELIIWSRSLRRLPSSMGRLSAMRTLDIDCDALEVLPESLGYLFSLERLKLKAGSLVSIPDSTGQLDSLTDLTIQSESLKSLPISFGRLSALQTLELECSILECLPESFGRLSILERLKLAGSLMMSPDSTSQLESLSDLMTEFESTRNEPASLGDLSVLKNLKLHCESLKTLPDALGNLRSLEFLQIRSRSLVRMPESIGKLSSLKYLNINAPNLSKLPSSFGQLSELLHLTIECDRLMKLPDNFTDLSSLTYLIIQENSLDSFREKRLQSLSWVLIRGERVLPPRGLWNSILNCVPFACIWGESYALLEYKRNST